MNSKSNDWWLRQFPYCKTMSISLLSTEFGLSENLYLFTIPWKYMFGKKLHWMKALSWSTSERRKQCILVLASIWILESTKRRNPHCTLSCYRRVAESMQKKGGVPHSSLCLVNSPSNTMFCCNFLYAWHWKDNAQAVFSWALKLKERNFP